LTACSPLTIANNVSTSSTIGANVYKKGEIETALSLKATLASPTCAGTVGGIAKVTVGLGNNENSNDAAKLVSGAT
jgi:hypothetical protein